MSSLPQPTAASEVAPAPLLDLCLTGFGKFCGVPENPTTALIAELPAFLAADDFMRAHVHFSSFTVLETSRECVPALLALRHTSEAPRKVCLHLGVAATRTRFSLEDRAFNEVRLRNLCGIITIPSRAWNASTSSFSSFQWWHHF